MEKAVSKQEIARLMPFDYNDNVLYFPIRHHSPVCSVQLKRVVEQYAPDCILIEGPENANDIIKYLADNETMFPAALYYTYKDNNSLVKSENIENNQQDGSPNIKSYSCYYPVLEYSPELVAIKLASELGIKARFIDMTFGKRLVATSEQKGVRKLAEKNSYSDDYLLSSTAIANALCEKTGFSDFDSFWEAHFEVNGLSLSPAEFVLAFNSYTYLLRKGTTKTDLLEDGTLLRERFMCSHIKTAKQQYKKILVVTGGFHTYGLIHPENDTTISEPNINQDDESIYLMPYSMEETDALNGYASGMVSPGFYQKVWENILEKQQLPYEKAVTDFIIQTAKNSKSSLAAITVSDEISALNVAKGLALLRGKEQCGKYECKDGIMSAFIKGDINPATEYPLDVLKDFFKGSRVGQIPKDCPAPPIVKDFLELAKKYRLKIDLSLKNEITLNVFSKPLHREISRFFHTLIFLDCGFVIQKRGSRIWDDKDKNLIREIFEYRFSPLVLTRLTEHSPNGGTVKLSAYNILLNKIKKAICTKDCALLLIDCYLMGLRDTLGILKNKTKDIINLDDDFFSIGDGLFHLVKIYNISKFYGEENKLDFINLIDLCFKRALLTIEYIKNCNSDVEQKAVRIIKLLYDISSKIVFSSQKIELLETLEKLLNSNNINSVIFGAISGILYGSNRLSSADITKSFNGFLTQPTLADEATKFLNGVFYTARDIVFVGDDFLKNISNLLNTLSPDEFIKLLPDLKLAFSYFTSSEIYRISKSVAKMLSIEENILNKEGVPEQTIIYGERLNQHLLDRLKEEN